MCSMLCVDETEPCALCRVAITCHDQPASRDTNHSGKRPTHFMPFRFRYSASCLCQFRISQLGVTSHQSPLSGSAEQRIFDFMSNAFGWKIKLSNSRLLNDSIASIDSIYITFGTQRKQSTERNSQNTFDYVLGVCMRWSLRNSVWSERCLWFEIGNTAIDESQRNDCGAAKCDDWLECAR